MSIPSTTVWEIRGPEGTSHTPGLPTTYSFDAADVAAWSKLIIETDAMGNPTVKIVLSQQEK